MSVRTASVLAAGLVLAAGAAISGAAPADAVPGLVTAQRTTAINSTAERVQTVTCPSGTRAIGGSAVIGGSTAVRINTETLDATSFTVLAHEPAEGVSESWYVVVTAQCAPVGSLPGLEYRRADSVYISTTTHTATASCSAGKKLIGVGGLVDSNGAGQDRLVLTAIRPAAALTSVVATASEDEHGYSGNWRVSAVAVCVNPVGQLLAVAEPPADSTASKQSTAVCPAGTRIHSGGFDLGSGQGQVGLRTSYLDPDVPSDPSRQGFVAQAREDRSGFAGTWRVASYGICAS